MAELSAPVPAVVNAIAAKFFVLGELFESREGPSKTFSWIAMMASCVLTSVSYSSIARVHFLTSPL